MLSVQLFFLLFRFCLCTGIVAGISSGTEYISFVSFPSGCRPYVCVSSRGANNVKGTRMSIPTQFQFLVIRFQFLIGKKNQFQFLRISRQEWKLLSDNWKSNLTFLDFIFVFF